MLIDLSLESIKSLPGVKVRTYEETAILRPIFFEVIDNLPPHISNPVQSLPPTLRLGARYKVTLQYMIWQEWVYLDSEGFMHLTNSGERYWLKGGE